MFGAEANERSLAHKPWMKPLVVLVLGVVLSTLGTGLALIGLWWFAPLFIGPSLTVMGALGFFLPGVTGVFGFDWKPYPLWQVLLGLIWFTATTVVPMFALSVMFVLSMWLVPV